MEEPPLKRFKPEDGSPGFFPPLPAGWTEHTAPTGHKYYYNKATKKSTYSRPAPDVVVLPQPVAVPPPSIEQSLAFTAHSANPVPFDYSQAARNPHAQDLQQPSQAYHNGYTQATPFQRASEAPSRARNEQQQRKPRHEPKDRPKRKETIPNCGAWVLVYTLLGRRFVHNTQTKESYWKFPSDVMKSVIAFDQLKLEEKHGKAPNGNSDAGQEKGKQAQDAGIDQKEVARHRETMDQNFRREQEEDAALLEGDEEERIWVPPAQVDKGYDSSEYEEIEVTDDSDADSQPDNNDDQDSLPAAGDGPLEFNEDDIAYQLAAMEGGEDQPFSDEEYSFSNASDQDQEEAALTDSERQQIFESLLTDNSISPFTPWSSLLSDPSSPLLADDRFTIFPSAKARAAAHALWAKTAIAARKEAAANSTETQDPRERFLEYLAGTKDAGPKLFWAEFKRKHKKDAEMKPVKGLLEKDMEKLYREYVAGLKMTGGEREAQLRKVLRAGKGDVRCDVAFWVVPERRREEIISEHSR